MHPQPEMIERLSHGATLESGSLILTGSPTAIGRKAPTEASSESPFMRDGDEVRCYVEGCGRLARFPLAKGIGGALTKSGRHTHQSRQSGSLADRSQGETIAQ